jgi:hypothetical protein
MMVYVQMEFTTVVCKLNKCITILEAMQKVKQLFVLGFFYCFFLDFGICVLVFLDACPLLLVPFSSYLCPTHGVPY